MGFEPTNTAVFVTARLGSSRLPGKVLADIGGRPSLWYILDRMSRPKLPNLRVVCTSTNPEDGEIAEFAGKNGWEVFRGDAEDVLVRHLGAAIQFGVEFFVDVEGDSPFCSADHVDLILERFIQTNADYISCDGLPLGGAPIGVKVSALQDVCARKGETNTQGWGKYFVQSGLYHTERLCADADLHRPQYRMTLDYPEDLEFFRTTVRQLDPHHETALDLREIVAFLDSHPEVVAINQALSDEYWARFQREHGAYTMKSDGNTPAE
jgi:spore coat polysaccharide biosynthesis protein SpsF